MQEGKDKVKFNKKIVGRFTNILRQVLLRIYVFFFDFLCSNIVRSENYYSLQTLVRTSVLESLYVERSRLAIASELCCQEANIFRSSLL